MTTVDQILYFVADPSLAARTEAQRGMDRAARRISGSRADRTRFAFETSAARTLAKLRSGGADALVVDARGEPGGVEESAALAILRALFGEHELPSAIGRERVWLVVGSDPRAAALAFEAGRLHLAGVIAAHEEGELFEAIWERVAQTTSWGRGGKIAICLAGGGTEGLLYELGVLRAIEHFLPGFRLADADIICGISAGAILGGLLANGIGPNEMRLGLRDGSDRIEPLRRIDMFDPNIGDLAKRAASLSWDVVRGKRSPLSAMFRLPPPGLFAGDKLRRWLERQYTRPGMIDRFSALPHKLLIGATDQDTSEHVLFGSSEAPDVPIHQAIRASIALAPFYAPERINGRYYVDGGFTRTTNMRAAVQEGATLVFLIDPLVPVSLKTAGHVAERGAIYTAMQGLKSLINGRFDKAVPTLKAMYPQVAFHLFQPGPDTRRVMAGSPMKFFYREAIEEIAYRETVRDVRRRRFEKLYRDFERHGVRFADPDARPASSRDHDDDDLAIVA